MLWYHLKRGTESLTSMLSTISRKTSPIPVGPIPEPKVLEMAQSPSL